MNRIASDIEAVLREQAREAERAVQRSEEHGFRVLTFGPDGLVEATPMERKRIRDVLDERTVEHDGGPVLVAVGVILLLFVVGIAIGMGIG